MVLSVFDAEYSGQINAFVGAEVVGEPVIGNAVGDPVEVGTYVGVPGAWVGVPGAWVGVPGAWVGVPEGAWVVARV